MGRVIAKAHDELHARLLLKVGADKIVFPERDMGRRMAHNLISGNILEFIRYRPITRSAKSSACELGGQIVARTELAHAV